LSQRHERCFYLAQQWIAWLDTKRYFAPPRQKNILLMLQKIQSREVALDPPLSPELSAFNLAVKAQPTPYLIPFLFVYCHASNESPKHYAHHLHLSLPAFYMRSHKCAASIYRRHLALIDDLNATMMKK
jgi:hypothetical protein